MRATRTVACEVVARMAMAWVAGTCLTASIGGCFLDHGADGEPDGAADGGTDEALAIELAIETYDGVLALTEDADLPIRPGVAGGWWFFVWMRGLGLEACRPDPGAADPSPPCTYDATVVVGDDAVLTRLTGMHFAWQYAHPQYGYQQVIMIPLVDLFRHYDAPDEAYGAEATLDLTVTIEGRTTHWVTTGTLIDGFRTAL